MELVCFETDDPREHLACDELLLQESEAGRLGEALRLYETAAPAVVIGVGQRWQESVHSERLAADGVPLLRRCSGGGAVLLAPGCLCYGLVLDVWARPRLAAVRSTHAWALACIIEALAGPGLELRQAGLSDLAWGAHKVGGSAQRRGRRFVLQHGTLLYGLDMSLQERFLRQPSDAPDYRGGRTHAEFCANLPLSRSELEGRLRRAFGALPPPGGSTSGLARAVRALVAAKYASPDWNLRL
jgi:lipoate-protein ligase A